MAYYTGQCTSYQNLVDILVDKCQTYGWTWQDNILSKDNLFIKISVVEQPVIHYYFQGQGITLTGGTGKQGNQLINPSGISVRMGRTVANKLKIDYFPAHYHLFIFSNEIYLLMKFNVDKFYYLAFGKSNLIHNAQANNLWLCATSNFFSHASETLPEVIDIRVRGGGVSSDYGATAVAPFWTRGGFENNWTNSVICHGFDNMLWSSTKSKTYATFEPLIERLPTAHFADSPLLPYNIYLERPENKLSLICQFENARCVRIDNYEPEQIITLGHERWMIFPFYTKNLMARDAGFSTHTGTFGWAIRFDG